MSFDAAVDLEIAELERRQVRADMPVEAFRERYLMKGRDGQDDGSEPLPMNHGGHSIVARGQVTTALPTIEGLNERVACVFQGCTCSSWRRGWRRSGSRR